MLLEYIEKAMSTAVYDKLEDGTYSGSVPDCPGTVAFADSLYQCQQELGSVLEGWLIVKIRHGDSLPVIGGLDLNKGIPAGRKARVHSWVDAVQATDFHSQAEEVGIWRSAAGWAPFLRAPRDVYPHHPQ